MATSYLSKDDASAKREFSKERGAGRIGAKLENENKEQPIEMTRILAMRSARQRRRGGDESLAVSRGSNPGNDPGN